MKDKHTPGPWKVDGTYIYEVEQDKILAEVETYNNNELPYEANARLMAAAPEMYELMPKLIYLLGSWAYIIDQIGNYDTSESWDLADKWIDIRVKIEGNEYNHLP